MPHNPSRQDAPPGLVETVGRSEAFLKFQERLSLAAKADRPVLVVGERGTGKELAASRLHYLSQRWDGPFVTVNCATLSSELLNSELFGHEAGAFTGAVRRRAGRFELAHGGALFLDEIGNLGRDAQERILRVVEYGLFERIGGESAISVDVRVIGATNADLPTLVRAGKFKADLLDRLSFEVLTIPPLRARYGDIPLLARHFATRMAVEMGFTEPPEFSDRALDLLENHPWPGNVRELKNVVERATFRSRGERIRRIVFDPFASPYRPAPSTPPVVNEPGGTTSEQLPAGPDAPDIDALALPEAVARIEAAYLAEALAAERHNQTRAAKRLGLTYNQFRGLLRKHRQRLGK